VRGVLGVLAAAVLSTACTRSAQEPDATPPATGQAVIPVDPKDARFRQAAEDRLARMRQDDDVEEQAPWFGQTGLPASVEREVPRYLRRELGQVLSAPGALLAADLRHVGSFVEGAQRVHYWRMPDGANAPYYAYVSIDAAGNTATGWGNRTPPP
jgi:hypothetical protein